MKNDDNPNPLRRGLLKALAFGATAIAVGGFSAVAAAAEGDEYRRSDHPSAWARHGIPQPRMVSYSGESGRQEGNIILDHRNQLLYLTLGNGRAMEYVVGVGRQGRGITGRDHYVSRMQRDPFWIDPSGDQSNNPFLNPGPQNPLGVRGLYLARVATQREEGFVIHGTNRPERLAQPNGSRRVSAGCIRMHNDDVLDLFSRVEVYNRSFSVRVHIFYNGEVAPHVGQRQSSLTTSGNEGIKLT